MPEPLIPHYGEAGLAGVLPSVVGALTGQPPEEGAELAPARRAVVVLIDGLGLRLLERHRGHAPFLRSLLAETVPLTAGFPSTTATSMGSFGTGRPPGAHGLTGYQVRDPQTGTLFNELSWDDGPRPEEWQPGDTWLQRAVRAGVETTMVAPAYFNGSGLTRAALRGARFRSAGTLAKRVDATLAALREDARSLVYLYWGDLDRTGHVHGCSSLAWCEELEQVDAQMRRLAGSVPKDCSFTLVADHGMVDIPMDNRVDVATDPELASGVDVVGGEMRALQLYCTPGAEEDVLATWSGRYATQAWVRTREQAVAEGWFGPVSEQVMPRIGEVLVAFHEPLAVVDSRVMRDVVIRLLGQHGSLTEDEMRVPMIHVPAAS